MVTSTSSDSALQRSIKTDARTKQLPQHTQEEAIVNTQKHTTMSLKRAAEVVLCGSVKSVKLVEKACSKCSTVKAVSQFSKNNSAKDGLLTRCKSCVKLYDALRINTHAGYCATLLKNSRSKTTIRNNRGRKHAHSITIEYIMQLPNVCYYTRVPLAFATHTDFQSSLERLNNSIGYVPGNVVMCCAELNNSAQMTREKVAQLFTGQLHCGVAFTDDELRAADKPKQQYKWLIDADGNVYCHFCDLVKPRTNFVVQLSKGCKQCIQDKARSTWWKVSARLYDNAKSSSRKGREEKTFNITQQDIIDQLVKQRGLCYYSHYPMNKSFDYKASLERLNPLIGYEKGNIVLILAEFNAGDRSSLKTKDSNEGSAGMSRRKFLHMLRHVLPEDEYEEYILKTGED
jgi:hypothetical protein